MGEAGVALSADANSAYWNASKLPFAQKDFGVSATYTPWLRNLTDGIWLGYASVYKKLGEKQAVAVSVNYFTNKEGLPVAPMTFSRSRDLALNATYARQFGKNFSIGLTLKYISSNAPDDPRLAYVSLKPARVVAGDISAYYRKQSKNDVTGSDLTWSFGTVLSNLGGKINYRSGTEARFIPTNIKLGGGLSYTADGRNCFSVILDASKLMVPTPQAGMNVNTKATLSGIFGSFSDAPGGLREEVQEMTWSGGVEYKYKNMLALRGGYFGESKYKGGRKYFTTGAGVRFLKSYDVDFSYLFPLVHGSPLPQTFRISLSVYLDTKKRISGAKKKI